MSTRGFQPSLTFGRKSVEVVPDDEADIPGAPHVVVVTGLGRSLAVIPADSDEVVTFDPVWPGFIPPFFVRRVMETDTTANVWTVES